MLLKIVAPLDQTLSARLVAILTQDAEREAKAENVTNSEGLIEAASYLVDRDPKLATELGVLALRVGYPSNIMSLLWKLRSKDEKLANLLFGEALAVARQSLNGDSIHSLVSAVFPEYYTPGFTPGRPVATDDMRTEVLKVYVVYLQSNSENRDSLCMSVVSIAPLLAEFNRLLPQQAVIIRQSINQCQSLSPLARQRVDDASRDQPLKTVEDLLKAGDDAQDVKVRTVYQFRAAMLAKQQNDFDRALKILDGMSTESREFMGESWKANRWDWAATSALRHLKSGDVYGMRLIINAVPSDLQPYAKMAFVDGLPADRDKDTDPTLEFLSDVRAVLHRSSLSDAERAVGYFGLLPLTLKYQPKEASDVLKEAIAALNRAAEAKDKNAGNNDSNSLSGADFSRMFPALLLEMDEYTVKEAVASITPPDIRVQVRLDLLSVCLERLRSSKQATPNQKRSTSKRE